MANPPIIQLALFSSFALVCLLLSVRSPWRGFLLCVVALPLEAAFVAEVGFTVRLSYVALLVTVLCLLLNPRQTISSRSPLDNFVVAYVLIAGLSIGMTLIYPPPDVTLSAAWGYRGSQFRPLIQWLLLLLFVAGYFLAVHFCSNARGLTIALRTYVIVASVVAVYGIYQFFAGHYHLPFLDITYATGRVTGAVLSSNPDVFRSHATFHEPMNFGHYLVSVLPLSLALFAHRRGTSRASSREWELSVPINFLQIAALLVALFFTGSRGSWFGFGLGALAILILAKKRVASPAIVLLTVGLAASVAFLIPYLVSGELLRAGYSRLAFDALRATGRWQYPAFSLDFWVNRPALWLFGTGIGNFGLHAAAHFGSSIIIGAYSLPVQILAETGLLGLVAFSLLIGRAYVILFHALKLSRGTVWEAYFVGYLASLTALFGQHMFFADRLPLYVWILLGCSIGTVKAMMSSQASGEFAVALGLPKYSRRLLEMVIDMVLLTVAYLGAYLLRFEGIISTDLARQVGPALLLVIGIKLAVLYLMGVYGEDRRHARPLDLMTLVKATMMGSLVVVGALFVWTGLVGHSRAALAIDWVLTLILLSGFRASTRFLRSGS